MSTATMSAVHLPQARTSFLVTHPLVGSREVPGWFSVCELAFDIASEKVKQDYLDSMSDQITLLADEIIASAKEL